MNNKYSKENIAENWKRLAGLTKVNEEKKKDAKSILLKSEMGADGNVYGLIQESNKYYLRVASGTKKNFSVDDFKFIGGINNKLDEKFDSYGAADRRLNGKLISINEMYENQAPANTEPEVEEPSIEDSLINDLNNIDNGGGAATTQQPPVQQPQPSAPVATAPTEQPQTAPEQPQASAPAPSQEAPAGDPNGGQTPDMQKINEPAPEGGEQAPTASSDVPPSAADGSATPNDGQDPHKEIQALLGKIGNATRNTEVTPDLAKNMLNTIVSAVKVGLPGVSDADKENIAQRIKQDGRKIEEYEVVSSNQGEIPGTEGQNNGTDPSVAVSAIGQNINSPDKLNINEMISSIVKEEISEKLIKESIEDINDSIKKKDQSEVNEIFDSPLQTNGPSSSTSPSVEEMPINEDLVSTVSSIIKPLIAKGSASIQALADKIGATLTPAEKQQADEFINSYSAVNEEEGYDYDSLLNNIRKGFKAGSKKSIAFVALMLILKLGGTAASAADAVKDKNDIKQKATQTLDSSHSGEKDVNNDEYSIHTKGTGDNGKSKVVEVTIKGHSKLIDKRGPRLKNQAVMAKSFETLDENVDSEKLEKVWRIIAQNPDKALKETKIIGNNGKVLASDIKLQQDNNVTFTMVFENPDSQFQGPYKMLAGELQRSPDEKLELKKIWVINNNHENMTIDPGNADHDALVKKAIESGFVQQGGTYDWIKPNAGVWIAEGPELKSELQSGKVRFDYKPFVNIYGAKGEKIQ